MQLLADLGAPTVRRSGAYYSEDEVRSPHDGGYDRRLSRPFVLATLRVLRLDRFLVNGKKSVPIERC